jgi:hypothetical protein
MYGSWSVRHPHRLVPEIYSILHVQSYEPEERYVRMTIIWTRREIRTYVLQYRVCRSSATVFVQNLCLSPPQSVFAHWQRPTNTIFTMSGAPVTSFWRIAGMTYLQVSLPYDPGGWWSHLLIGRNIVGVLWSPWSFGRSTLHANCRRRVDIRLFRLFGPEFSHRRFLLAWFLFHFWMIVSRVASISFLFLWIIVRQQSRWVCENCIEGACQEQARCPRKLFLQRCLLFWWRARRQDDCYLFEQGRSFESIIVMLRSTYKLGCQLMHSFCTLSCFES